MGLQSCCFYRHRPQSWGYVECGSWLLLRTLPVQVSSIDCLSGSSYGLEIQIIAGYFHEHKTAVSVEACYIQIIGPPNIVISKLA